MPKEVVIISGKGGTGKTSVVAAFASLAVNKVMTDCDVDAADLHLILQPKVLHREKFTGGKKARIQANLCTACGTCEDLCRFDAVRMDGPANEGVGKTYIIDPISCEGCGVCVRYCPTEAILFEESLDGEWFISDTRVGPMVHAKLGIAQGNSGKLVSIVRDKAKEMAKEEGHDLIISDGSPGIGCPVIASLAGADLALAVTEPTLSGLHDCQRVAELARHFGIPVAVVINKYDLNEDVARDIERWAKDFGAEVLGRIPYDPVVTKAQLAGKSVIEYGDGEVAKELISVWGRVRDALR
ncbi:MAG: 4Fe-4S dicluster domain-containing protein [Planctomycetes bacterium]|nr:4Fe-4S dicluster domain-containing protein [Planctomycetota bacterium]